MGSIIQMDLKTARFKTDHIEPESVEIPAFSVHANSIVRTLMTSMFAFVGINTGRSFFEITGKANEVLASEIGTSRLFM